VGVVALDVLVVSETVLPNPPPQTQQASLAVMPRFSDSEQALLTNNSRS